MASDRRTSAKRPPRPAAKKAPPPPSTRKPSAAGAAAAAAAAKRKPQVPRRRRRRDLKKTIAAWVAVVLVGALVVFFAFAISGSTGTPTSSPAASVGPEKVPVPAGKTLANINTAVYGQAIDGISCDVNEQVKYHIHAHLAIFVDGTAKQVPLGIGISPPLHMGANTGGEFVSGGSCFYWLHTHAADGIVHVESPSSAQYTLGNFFDVWGQPLATGQVGPAPGKVSAYVDGKPFTGDPRSIPLTNHAAIQLDVGRVVPPTAVDWTSSGL